MTRATLWIEMTIAGAVYVISLFFLVAWLYGVEVCDLKIYAGHLEPYKTYVALAAVAISYIFGFVAHRVIQIISRIWEWKPLRLLLNTVDYLAIWGLEKRMHDDTTIWEMSPQRIHHELDFQFAQVALLRSLMVSIPILAFSICHWRPGTWHDVYIGFWVFYVCLLFAFRRQSRQYGMIQDNALEAARRHVGHLVPSLSPISGPVKTLVTIKGINFGEKQGTVTFDKKKACPTIWEPTRIVVPVPDEVVASDDKLEGKVLITIECTVPDTNTGESFTLRLTCPHFTVTKSPEHSAPTCPSPRGAPPTVPTPTAKPSRP